MMLKSGCDPDDDDAAKKMAAMFGPAQVDHMIRQAIQFCWLGLPPERKTPEEMERQVRRIVDRALRDFREDAEAFGQGG